MYYHLLVPIDCTPDSQRAMLPLLRYAEKMPSCKVTLVAAVSPAPTAEMRAKRRLHAQEALTRLHDYLNSYGLYSFERIVEAEEPADGFAQEARVYDEQYDLIVLSPAQTRLESFDAPCIGSLADRIGQRSEIPVLILPGTRERLVK